MTSTIQTTNLAAGFAFGAVNDQLMLMPGVNITNNAGHAISGLFGVNITILGSVGASIAAFNAGIRVGIVGQNSIIFVGSQGTIAGYDGINSDGSIDLTNYGQIFAAGSGGFGVRAVGTSTVVNFGTIASASLAFNIASSTTEKFTVTNFGSISTSANTAYAGGSGIDYFTNAGRIAGNVALNLGDDTYYGNQGYVAGTVSGGSGNDTFVGGNANDVFSGDAGNDIMHGSGGDDTLNGGFGIDTATYMYAWDQYYLARVGGNTWRISGAIEGQDTLTSIEKLQFADRTVSLSNEWHTANHDADADGDADILWFDTASGQATVFYMNGTTQTGFSVIGAVNPSQWSVVGSGDFNGDGTADFLLRNTATGEIDDWFVRNGQLIGGGGIGTPGTAWQVAGTGDFNGDGTADIVLRNGSTGEIDVWLVKNGQLIGGGYVSNPGTGVSVVGTGDFNDDGYTDIFVRNNTTGEVDAWLMKGNTIQPGSGQIFTNTALQVLGVGDFNGDNVSDLLVQTTATGALSIYSTGVGLYPSFSTLTNQWSVGEIGDFNNDGTSDIAWRNSSNGELDIWLMNNNTIASGGAFVTLPNSWKTVA